MDLRRLSLRLVVQEMGQVIPEKIIIDAFEQTGFGFIQWLA